MSDENNVQKTSLGLEPKIESMLCYVLGWITGLIFLLLEKDDKTVRFHAWQSIFTFGSLHVISVVISYIPFINLLTWVVQITSFVMWLILLIKTYQGETYKVPIAGDLAEQYNNK